MNEESYYRNSQTSRLLSPTDSKRLKAQIDALLQNDFAVLSRHSQINQESLMTAHNNPLLMHYIQHIYQEYDLPDPLPKKYSSKISENQNKTNHKKIKLVSLKDDFSTPSRQNPQFKYRKNKNGESPEFQTAPTRVTQFSPDKEIGSQIPAKMGEMSGQGRVQTGSKYFSEYKQISFNQESRNLKKKRQESYIKEQLPQSQQPAHKSTNFVSKTKNIVSKITFNTPPQAQFATPSTPISHLQESSRFFTAPKPLPQIVSSIEVPRQEIKESFRYCIGCDKPLLEANLAFHERKCQQFQKVLHMPMQEIVSYLKKKIAAFQANIQRYSEEILKVDPQQMSQHSQRLIEQSRAVFGSGEFSQAYHEEYNETVSMSSKWCIIAEEINKVNWFLKIRKRLKQSISI